MATHVCLLSANSCLLSIAMISDQQVHAALVHTVSPQSVCFHIAFRTLLSFNQYMPFKDKARVSVIQTIILIDISHIQNTQLVHNYMHQPAV